VFTVVHSAQRPCPGPNANFGTTVTVPRLGNGDQFIVNVCGGTTAGMAWENGLAMGPVESRRVMLNVAGTVVPRLKFMVRVLLVKLAVKPQTASWSAVDHTSDCVREPQSAIRSRCDSP
jgi:hypothetical protein